MCETPIPTEASSEWSAQPHLLIAAWSAASVVLACRLTLPSLLAPGNLGRLDRDGPKIPATVLCLEADRVHYEASAAFQAFARDRIIDWYALDAHADLLDDAREAIASEAFRAAMARHQRSGAERSFLLVKGGHVFADGALAGAAQLLAGGASAVMAPVPMVSVEILIQQVTGHGSGLSPRSLARAAMSDAAAAASLMHECGGMLGFGSESGDADAGASSRRLWTARLHPVGLRPEHPVDPARESLIDAEIVPEFTAAERRVHRAASSDEILILEARSPQMLLQDVAAAPPAVVAARIAAWATPWHLSNLASPYDLIGTDGKATPAAGASPLLPAGPGIPADQHPAWLAARGFRSVPGIFGRERRYMSLLDGHYRVARSAIEAADAGAAIYAGLAETTFAPLLRRLFDRAMVGNVPQTLLAARRRLPARAGILHVIHIDLGIFAPLVGELAEAVHALSLARCPVILLVEAHDDLGGIPEADLDDLRHWCRTVARAAEGGGGATNLTATALEFFNGHQGFLLTVTPRPHGTAHSGSEDRPEASDRAPLLAEEAPR